MSQYDLLEKNEEINKRSVKNALEMSQVDMREINIGEIKPK